MNRTSKEGQFIMDSQPKVEANQRNKWVYSEEAARKAFKQSNQA